MLAAIRPLVLTIVFCGATVGLTACDKANAQNDNPASAVKSEELIRTSQSWDGVELPDYLQGRPELVAVKYEFPAGQKLGWHHHPVMNYGILVQGELTIIGQDGRENTVHEARHPLHVLSLAGGSAPCRAASGDSAGVTSTLTSNDYETEKTNDYDTYS